MSSGWSGWQEPRKRAHGSAQKARPQRSRVRFALGAPKPAKRARCASEGSGPSTSRGTTKEPKLLLEELAKFPGTDGLLCSTPNLFEYIKRDVRELARARQEAAGETIGLRQRLLEDKSADMLQPRGFRGGAYSLDRMSDVRVTFALNLFRDGFTIDNQPIRYPYDHDTREFLANIDKGFLPGDQLDEVPCFFYDGCVVVEVRDHRLLSQSPGASGVRRILLQPDTRSKDADIDAILVEYIREKRMIKREDEETAGGRVLFTTDDRIELEKRIIQATAGDICLDPSPSVQRVANLLHYNARKFNAHPFRGPTVGQRPEDPHQRLPTLLSPLLRFEPDYVPSVFLNDKDLPAFISLSGENVSRGSKEIMTLVHKLHRRTRMFRDNVLQLPSQVRKALAMCLKFGDLNGRVLSSVGIDPAGSRPPEPASASERELLKPQQFGTGRPQRCLRFQGNTGRTFCYLETYALRPSVFEGAIREGDMPDTGANGHVVRFELGNEHDADKFVEQFKNLYQREGNSCVHDSTNPAPRHAGDSQQQSANPAATASNTGQARGASNAGRSVGTAARLAAQIKKTT